MKRALPLILVLAFPLIAVGANINQVGTSFSIDASTSSWTLVTSTISFPLPNRTGISISNPISNSAAVAVIPVNKNSTNSYPITVRPFELEEGEEDYFPFGVGVDVYVLSLHTSSQTVHIVEGKQ